MTESSNLEKRPGDLERRHDKTREYLIDAYALAMAALADLYFKPEGGGVIAVIVVLGGAFGLTRLLLRWLMKD